MISYNEWNTPYRIIDEETCQKIISLGDDGFETAKIGHKRNESPELSGIVNENIRVSDVKRLLDCRWIVDLISPIVNTSNIEAGWKYDVKGVEALQLTRYRVGEFYDWHKDGKGDHTSALTYGDDPNEYVRKLSLTVLLNSDYEGGQFQFASYNNPSRTIIATPEFNKTGSMIIFPSYMEHRVTPVIKGTRYSLVAWFLGPPFR